MFAGLFGMFGFKLIFVSDYRLNVDGFMWIFIDIIFRVADIIFIIADFIFIIAGFIFIIADFIYIAANIC